MFFNSFINRLPLDVTLIVEPYKPVNCFSIIKSSFNNNLLNNFHQSSFPKIIPLPNIDKDSWHEKYYDGRNYYLFSILADVRNVSGVEPINYPKGIPDDASTGYLYKCEQWDSDAHSHSYFTLDELLNVDWSQYDSEYIDEFMETLEEMKEIDADPLNVRCCFFFDN